MVQNKYLVFIFLVMLINGEVRGQPEIDHIRQLDGYGAGCYVSWNLNEFSYSSIESPPAPPINTTFSVDKDIGTYILNLGSSSSLTSQISQGIYSAAVTGVSAIPGVGTAISAIGSFFSFLFGGGDIELN